MINDRFLSKLSVRESGHSSRSLDCALCSLFLFECVLLSEHAGQVPFLQEVSKALDPWKGFRFSFPDRIALSKVISLSCYL